MHTMTLWRSWSRCFPTCLAPLRTVLPVKANRFVNTWQWDSTSGSRAGSVTSGAASIYAVSSSCDSIVTVSGTVTLQAGLSGTPMAIFYKLSPLSYAIGKHLVRVEHFGLPNIVAGERIVPEFLQEMATPQALAAEVLHVLQDDDYAGKIRAGLRRMRLKLGEPGCSGRVARMLLTLLREQPQG